MFTEGHIQEYSLQFYSLQPKKEETICPSIKKNELVN